MSCGRKRRYKGHIVTHVHDYELQVDDGYNQVIVAAQAGVVTPYQYGVDSYRTVRQALDHAIEDLQAKAVRGQRTMSPDQVKQALLDFMEGM